MTRGGIVLRAGGEVFFVPASVALRVAPWPRVTPVPGSPAGLSGMAMHEGAVIPVLAIGDARGEMVVVQHAGEVVGLVGAEVLRTGAFAIAPGRPDSVVHEDRPVRPLDIAAIYARVQSTARAGRWG
jgi:hypothetical protein